MGYELKIHGSEGGREREGKQKKVELGCRASKVSISRLDR